MSISWRWIEAEPCSRPGVYCSKCRFRMLPSAIDHDSDKMFYCMVCRTAIGQTTGTSISILSLVKGDKAA